MEYAESNGVSFKVESIILDDETFAVVYSLKLAEVAPAFDWVNLADLTVKDENGIVLYGEGKGMISTGGMSSIASEDNQTIKISHINSNENHNYPKSKKLCFSMQNVNLINSKIQSDKDGAKIVQKLSGNWEFEIDVAEQFSERTAIQYSPALNDRIKVKYAELTPTGLNLEIELANEKFDIAKRMTLAVDDTVYENDRQIAVEDDEKTIRTSFPITIFNAPDKVTFIYDGTEIELTR
ncbi:MAG: hypothetical protein LBS85_02975 [Clostridiales Family XIII bacterium]|jgi:hypothetical protein|nr:hypothetical protein [Clostridiales Family XIII bacterium]